MSGWAITECGLGMCPDWTLLDENGDSVGFVYDMDHASLMAAAPDMADALADAISALECCGKDYDYVLSKAKAALAKAEGRS